MEDFDVNSSMIDSPIRYDAEHERLELTFSGSGETWEYMPFPESEWDALKDSGSVGSFFHRRIKGLYSARRIS